MDVDGGICCDTTTVTIVSRYRLVRLMLYYQRGGVQLLQVAF